MGDNWARNDWGANYYSWGLPMTIPMYWGNTPEQKNKGNRKGGKQSHAWPNLGQDHAGGDYAQSDWELKTNERSISKQTPLLSEFSGYSEGGGRSQKMGKDVAQSPLKFSDRLFYHQSEGKFRDN